MKTGLLQRTLIKVLPLVIGGSLAASLTADEKSAARPNILFIMLDDLGKEWISCYGAEDIQTPNIDTLADGGMKFNNAYSMPSCTPSRSTLLTGKYPWGTGFVNHWDVPRWGVTYFDWKKKENTNFARLMKGLDYATCAVGKWQINDFRLERMSGSMIDGTITISLTNRQSATISAKAMRMAGSI
ncbi:sulfatase-like hydrolase/transferase [Verrucomicrobia bacterium]|nr:sulfatase-like hydrolase/transferase [Verrucomicrobiota bacterium]